MNVFKPLCLIVALFTTLTVSAQNFGDALRYSNFDPIGTARFMGAGSALGPLGADFSVLSTNPAGLAWIRQSEFMVTPGLYINSVNSNLARNNGQNLSFDDAAVKFNLPNIGIVTSSRGGRSMETFNFAMGINRLADFSEEFYYRGTSRGSIVQRFEELANANGLDDFEAGVAFDAEALIEDNNFYFSDFSDFPEEEIEREETVVREGKIEELSFGFAGNVKNKVLWGFSIGVPFMRYEERKQYRETDPNDNVPIFNDLQYDQTLIVNGTGINAKLGVIYRADQALRLSAAIHTPTFYQVDETFTTRMEYDYTLENQNQFGSASSPEGSFNYSLRTPWRFMAGAGAIFAKNGFLTGEIEYVNYGSNKFLFEGFSGIEAEVNQETRDNLSDAVRVRTGAEYAIEDFRLRGGVGLQQAAIEGDDNFYTTFSLGAGIRKRAYYLDIAYRHNSQQTSYTPYLTGDAPQQFVDNDVVRENFVFTLGFRW